MKKILKISLVVLAVTMMVTSLYNFRTEAKTKNKVTYTLKKGTLTIKGKGNMPKKMVFKGNKKIKKVVIKNGVTSINKSAFENCKNLKTVKIGKSVTKIGKKAFYRTKIKNVTIPKAIKTINKDAFGLCTKLTTVTMPGKKIDCNSTAYAEPSFLPHVKTIRFTTKLNIKAVTLYDTDNYVVYKKDPKYTSITGIIYTKDKKTTVRLPNRKNITIADGCTEFTMESLLYSVYQGGGNFIYNCYNVRTLVLPKTIKKISKGKGFEVDYSNLENLYYLKLQNVVVKNKDLSEQDIKTFTTPFEMEFITSYVKSEKGDNTITLVKKNK